MQLESGLAYSVLWYNYKDLNLQGAKKSQEASYGLLLHIVSPVADPGFTYRAWLHPRSGGDTVPT